jgi:hypothetical protein
MIFQKVHESSDVVPGSLGTNSLPQQHCVVQIASIEAASDVLKIVARVRSFQCPLGTSTHFHASMTPAVESERVRTQG